MRKMRAPAGALHKSGPTVAATAAAPELRKEKENMSDFIAKKREIFLLQMSLDTKRAEIKKLDERARLVISLEGQLQSAEKLEEDLRQQVDDACRRRGERGHGSGRHRKRESGEGRRRRHGRAVRLGVERGG